MCGEGNLLGKGSLPRAPSFQSPVFHEYCTERHEGRKDKRMGKERESRNEIPHLPLAGFAAWRELLPEEGSRKGAKTKEWGKNTNQEMKYLIFPWRALRLCER
jgi:hypothetical protein